MKQFFSELIYGNNWKKEQISHSQKENSLIIGPSDLFFILLSMIYIGTFLYFFNTDDNTRFLSKYWYWHWLIFGLLVFLQTISKIKSYNQGKNSIMAYWNEFGLNLIVFGSGILWALHVFCSSR